MITENELLAFPPLFFRVLGVMVLLPFSQNLSQIGKLIGISTVLALFFLPFAAAAEMFSISDLIFEFLLGVVIGLPCALVIDAVRSLGELFDSQRGASFAGLYDPTMTQSASFSSIISSNYCILVLVSAGMIETILFALRESLLIYPVMSLSVDRIFGNSLEIVGFISVLLAGAFKSFLTCAVLFLLVDLASVFISKVLPQSALNQEVFLIKSLLGFGLIIILLGFNWGPSLSQLAMPQMELLKTGP